MLCEFGDDAMPEEVVVLGEAWLLSEFGRRLLKA